MQHQTIYHPSFTQDQIDLWEKTIKAIEAETFIFDMLNWANYACGTPACIGGHAEYVIRGEDGTDIGSMSDDALNKALGITEAENWSLFYSGVPFNPDRAKALRVVRHFLTTRKIDWNL